MWNFCNKLLKWQCRINECHGKTLWFFICYRVTTGSIFKDDIDGVAQDCNNSSVLAMELLQSCTKPSMFIGEYWLCTKSCMQELWVQMSMLCIHVTSQYQVRKGLPWHMMKWIINISFHRVWVSAEHTIPCKKSSSYHIHFKIRVLSVSHPMGLANAMETPQSCIVPLKWAWNMTSVIYKTEAYLTNCKFGMMTSTNGDIFRVTGHLCKEFSDPRSPHTKASDAELWCFLWSASG